MPFSMSTLRPVGWPSSSTFNEPRRLAMVPSSMTVHKGLALRHAGMHAHRVCAAPRSGRGRIGPLFDHRGIRTQKVEIRLLQRLQGFEARAIYHTRQRRITAWNLVDHIAFPIVVQ